MTTRAELRNRARQAFLANRVYLEKVNAGTVTQAEHIAQVVALTREMQGVLRQIVGRDLLDEWDT